MVEIKSDGDILSKEMHDCLSSMRRESEYEMVDHNGPQRGAGKRRGGLKEGT